MTDFDLIIIGAGPAGYVCAIRAAQLGLKVACVDKNKSLGGTCLNVGCIPSKALLYASEKYEETQNDLGAVGVEVKGVSLDLASMMAHKDGVVKSNSDGIDFLFKKNKITKITGEAEIVSAGVVKVGKKQYEADSTVIATGSAPMELPNIKINEKNIVTSTGALSLNKVPKTLAVIGAGAIGLEMASIWRRAGSKVEIIEFTDSPLPGMDGSIRKEVASILTKQGVSFSFSSKVTQAKSTTSSVKFKVETNGKSEERKAEVLLVAAGRRPYTSSLGIDKVGVEMDERGFVKVDNTFETSVEGIYAIGDVIKGPMLAHKAEEDGVALAELLAGQEGHVDYSLVPAVVYTHPEVASVGKTQEALKEEGTDYKTGVFKFAANGRARAMNKTHGFVKLLTCSKTDKLLGAHIIGESAGELIAITATTMSFDGSAEDLARTCAAHPTLAEAVKEAALAAGNGAIHA